MKSVKITTRSPRPNLFRQTPGSEGLWRQYRFHGVNDKVEEADYWIVYEGLPQTETVRLNAGKTILITGEPPDNKSYHPGFVAQFDMVISCHDTIRHPGLVLSQQGLPWIAGEISDGRPRSTRRSSDVVSYDDLVDLPLPKKSALISAVTSNLRQTPGHILRTRLLEELKIAVPELDLFGRGHQFVPDKKDALQPYRFHLVLENSAIDHYWTEKLADSFLFHAYPIYWGAPNIEEYFPKDSLLRVDISNPEAAAQTIRKFVSRPLSNKRLAAMQEARNLVLDKYNLFELMAGACDQAGHDKPVIRTLKPQEAFFGFAAYQAAYRSRRWIKARLQALHT